MVVFIGKETEEMLDLLFEKDIFALKDAVASGYI